MRLKLMKIKHVVILLILACFLISLSNVSANDDLNMKNISTVDEKIDLEVSKDIETIDDLDSEIQNAKPNSTIKLENDIMVNQDTKCKGLEISERITLDGQGHKIDGNSSNMDFLLRVHADGVSLKNVVFTNWDLTYSFNLIEWIGANGEMKNCTFINNTALYGGAVDWTGINGFLINSTFINNTAENGGGLYWYGIEGTIANCIFFNNTAEIGGAVYITGRDTKLDASKFRINSANDMGGAVYAEGLNFVLSKCDFANNTAINGGAFYSIAYPNLIDSCNFTDNSADETAGAIYLASDNNTVKNSIFRNNSAASNGGAIYSDVNDELFVLNSKFNNNSAEEFGGAIMVDSYANIVNSTFDGNNATTGGAVYSDSETEFTNSTFSNNRAENGGAMAVNDGSIVNTAFVKNFANQTGGAIYVSGDFNLDKVYFNNNAAGNGSENIYLDDAHVTMVMNMTIGIKNITFGDTLNVKVTLPKDITKGMIKVNVNGKIYKTNLTSNQATVNVANLNSGSYSVLVFYEGSEFNSTTFDYEVDVFQRPVVISAAKKSFVINYAGKYSVVVKGKNGKVIAGQKVSFYINNKKIKTVTTSKKGVAAITLAAGKLRSLKAGYKTLKVTMSSNFNPNSKSVKITIKKERTKVVANKKTFKKSLRIKKYTIQLKNSKNKVIKKAVVYLKVKGKTYKAKTNSKGKATFKITKLYKKGKFTAKITFKTNKYYMGVSKKVRLTIR